MKTTLMIGLVIFITVFLFIRAPKGIVRFIGSSTVRIAIGVLFLFFFNVFGGSFGLHIPINIFTVFVSSILGLSGVMSLAAVHVFVLS